MSKHRIPHLALRMVRERTIAIPHTHVRHGREAADVARSLIGDYPTEHLIAILLNGTSQVTGVVTLSMGGMHTSSIRPSDVLRAVLTAQASAFILAHNHPSGDPTPSRDDVVMTHKLVELAKLLGVPCVDHVIVTSSEAFSCIPFPE